MRQRVDLPCQFLFSFIVRYDGSVRLCGCRFNRSDMDDMVVGNIQEHSLIEISKNSKSWEIIKGFYAGRRPDTCLGCSLYNPINRVWLRNQQQSIPRPREQSGCSRHQTKRRSRDNPAVAA